MCFVLKLKMIEYNQIRLNWILIFCIFFIGPSSVFSQTVPSEHFLKMTEIGAVLAGGTLAGISYLAKKQNKLIHADKQETNQKVDKFNEPIQLKKTDFIPQFSESEVKSSSPKKASENLLGGIIGGRQSDQVSGSFTPFIILPNHQVLYLDSVSFGETTNTIEFGPFQEQGDYQFGIMSTLDTSVSSIEKGLITIKMNDQPIHDYSINLEPNSNHKILFSIPFN